MEACELSDPSMPATPQPELTIVSQPCLHEFCTEVCRNNPAAMEFCNLWFIYCHAIDDLIDDQERPSAERLIEVSVQANLVYSSSFYQAYLKSLQPVVLLIANAYADSVHWEKSSVTSQSTISDVLRCCGNEMFFTVAMICGGWKHARNLSSRIRERSWDLQHEQTEAQ